MEERVRSIRESRGLEIHPRPDSMRGHEIAEHMARVKLGFKQLVRAVNNEDETLTGMAIIDLQYYLEHFGVHYGFPMEKGRENLLQHMEEGGIR